jgi:Cd2+/Zn2+-exporting ATPase
LDAEDNYAGKIRSASSEIFPSATALLWEDDRRENKSVRVARLLLSITFLLVMLSRLAPELDIYLALGAWALSGWDIVLKAALNILHGKFFDEKSLVTLTSICAFLLGAYGEAALIMLLFMLGERLEVNAIYRAKRDIVALPDPYPEQISSVLHQKAPAEKLITGFARYYTPIVIALALGVALVPPLFFKADFTVWGYRALVILVASCPCSLVIAIPITFFAGIGLASRRQIFFKGSNYLSALARTGEIIFDNKGVLTKDTYCVDQVIPAPDVSASTVLEAAAIAQSRSTGPYATGVLAMFGKVPLAYEGDSSLENTGHGITVTSKGSSFATGSLDYFAQNKISGLPLIPAATHYLLVSAAGKYIGIITFKEDIRQDAPAAIEKLRRMGIARTILLSSSPHESAGEQAARLGIGEVYAELDSAGKLALIEDLSRNANPKKAVVYVGSSAADAPALARCEVGLAMGSPASGTAINAADVIMMTNQLSSISLAIAVARKTTSIARQNIALVLLIKAFILLAGFFGIASIWGAVIANIGGALLAILNSGRLTLFPWKN